jgi:antitoxin component HigA of HigAB toxin-antitoxin module
MTAIAELRKKAAEKFDGYTVEFENDTLHLKSLLALNDAEMKKFTAAQKALTELDEEEAEVEAVRDQFVECLVSAAEDKRKARKLLGGESIALLMVVLEEYGASVSEATKSEGAE